MAHNTCPYTIAPTHSKQTARGTIEAANPALRLPLPPQHWPPELSKYLNAYTLLVRTLLRFLYLFKDDLGLLREYLISWIIPRHLLCT